MPRINRPEDLPEWFDIENYRGADRFCALRWYEQLSQRRHLLLMLKLINNEIELDGDFVPDFRPTFLHQVSSLRGRKVEEGRIPKIFDDDEAIANQLAADKRGVHSLSFQDLREHANNVTGRNGKAAEWFARMNAACEEAGSSRQSSVRPLLLTKYLSGHEERYAAAIVDLDLPDELLMRSFSIWLKEVRDNSSVKREKKFYKPNFERWAMYGVLPYLDLIIWEMETGNSITDGVMAASLFPGDYDGVNTLRSTKKWARLLMDDMSELAAIAAAEATPKAASNQEIFEG